MRRVRESLAEKRARILLRESWVLTDINWTSNEIWSFRRPIDFGKMIEEPFN